VSVPPLEIVYRGLEEEGDASPLRLPVDGADLEYLRDALRPLHFVAGPVRPDHGVPGTDPLPLMPPLACRVDHDPEPARRPAPTLKPIRARITAAEGGDLLRIPGGSLRLRAGGGDTLTCRRAVRGAFPLLLEMALIHALALRGVPVFHGAAFTFRGVPILALGQSGTGKTTLAAAAIRAGGRVVSDDSVAVLTHHAGGVSAQPFRRDFQVRPGSRRLFPGSLASRLEPLTAAAEPKWTLRREAAASRFTDDVCLRRIWVITLDRRLRRCRIAPLSQAEVFAALIQGSSPLYLSGRYPRERGALMPVLHSLAEQAPAYGVRLGRALLDDPVGELARLEATVRSANRS